jgi:hypothetical protein
MKKITVLLIIISLSSCCKDKPKPPKPQIVTCWECKYKMGPDLQEIGYIGCVPGNGPPVFQGAIYTNCKQRGPLNPQD